MLSPTGHLLVSMPTDSTETSASTSPGSGDHQTTMAGTGKADECLASFPHKEARWKHDYAYEARWPIHSPIARISNSAQQAHAHERTDRRMPPSNTCRDANRESPIHTPSRSVPWDSALTLHHRGRLGGHRDVVTQCTIHADMELLGIAFRVLLFMAAIVLPFYYIGFHIQSGHDRVGAFPAFLNMPDVHLPELSQLTIKCKVESVDLLAGILLLEVNIVAGGNFTSPLCPGYIITMPEGWEEVHVTLGSAYEKRLQPNKTIRARGEMRIDMSPSKDLSRFPFDTYTAAAKLRVSVHSSSNKTRRPLPVGLQLSAGSSHYSLSVQFSDVYTEFPDAVLAPEPVGGSRSRDIAQHAQDAESKVHQNLQQGLSGSDSLDHLDSAALQSQSEQGPWSIVQLQQQQSKQQQQGHREVNLARHMLGRSMDASLALDTSTTQPRIQDANHRMSGMQAADMHQPHPEHLQLVRKAHDAGLADYVLAQLAEDSSGSSTAALMDVVITVSRATGACVFSIVLVAIMCLLSAFLLALTVDIMFVKKRRVSAPFFAGSVTMLFALPGLRNAQPGIPPITVVGDVLGYYVSIVMVSASVLMLMARMAGQYRTQHLLRD